MNIAIVMGQLRTAPEYKNVAGEELLIVFDVETLDLEGKKSTVPVSWRGLETVVPADLSDLGPGDDIVIQGTVSRRFIGAAGFLVDVRAHSITTGGTVKRRNAVRKALAAGSELAA